MEYISNVAYSMLPNWFGEVMKENLKKWMFI